MQQPLAGSVDNDPTGGRTDPTVQRTGFADPLGSEPMSPRDDTRLASSNNSFSSVRTRSLLSPELTDLSPQPRFGLNLPDREVAVSRGFQVQTQSEPLSGRAEELPLAPLQRAAAQAAPEAMETGSAWTFDAVQRLGPDSPSSEASSAPTQGASPGEAGSGFSNANSTIGSVAASHQAPEADMDELAGKLYDKIRTRLKSELLVDRERAGFLTDLR